MLSSCPASFRSASFLSYHFLSSCHIYFLSCFLPVLFPSCPASFLSCLFLACFLRVPSMLFQFSLTSIMSSLSLYVQCPYDLHPIPASNLCHQSLYWPFLFVRSNIYLLVNCNPVIRVICNPALPPILPGLHVTLWKYHSTFLGHI